MKTFWLVVRGRVELPTFRFSGGRSYQLSYLTMAVLTGFEPATSTLTGWRALRAALQDHVPSPPTGTDGHKGPPSLQTATPWVKTLRSISPELECLRTSSSPVTGALSGKKTHGWHPGRRAYRRRSGGETRTNGFEQNSARTAHARTSSARSRTSAAASGRNTLSRGMGTGMVRLAVTLDASSRQAPNGRGPSPALRSHSKDGRTNSAVPPNLA
jgi:hypothetical protein